MKDQREIITEMLPIVQHITINGGALEPKPGTVTLADIKVILLQMMDLIKERSGAL